MSCAGRCDRCETTTAEALLRAAGADASHLEGKPCPWWWGVEETRDNAETGQVETRRRWACGKTILPRYLGDYGSAMEQAAAGVQRQAAVAEVAVSAALASAARVGPEGWGRRLVRRLGGNRTSTRPVLLGGGSDRVRQHQVLTEAEAQALLARDD
jgi:hypothetical protein